MPKGSKNRILELFKEGYSYNEIAEKLRCSKGTISFHCSKLRENKFSEHRLREYQHYYDEGNSLNKVSSKFNISRQSLGKYLIQRKINKESKNLNKLKTNSNYRLKVKTLAVQYKGGKCELCGYNKITSALEFHHINPKEKDYSISGGTKSFENIKKELDKCMLVCSNCHKEIHSNLHPEIYPRTDTAQKG